MLHRLPALYRTLYYNASSNVSDFPLTPAKGNSRTQEMLIAHASLDPFVPVLLVLLAIAFFFVPNTSGMANSNTLYYRLHTCAPHEADHATGCESNTNEDGNEQ